MTNPDPLHSPQRKGDPDARPSTLRPSEGEILPDLLPRGFKPSDGFICNRSEGILQQRIAQLEAELDRRANIISGLSDMVAQANQRTLWWMRYSTSVERPCANS